jgi:hypothetical protein
MKEKEYYVVVKIETHISVSAENEEHAKAIIKDIYEQDHNISLDDSEIIEITEQPNSIFANTQKRKNKNEI